ncbi:MAG: uracil-DNA glycosylase [Polyangiaceae bacterium]|nr:uracil-DNA glycosylase [Polyangiaceae bacterium]
MSTATHVYGSPASDTRRGEDPDVGELTELTRSLLAHVEWQRATGATGLPRASAQLSNSRLPAEIGEVPPTARGAVPAPSESLGPARLPVAPAPESRAGLGGALADQSARSARLLVLAQEVSGCARCGLHEGRTQTVFSRGTGSSGVCFVGEGPGADEDAQGFPFVGAAGQLLDRMIGAMGLGREDVYVCNIVKCRPPNNRKPSPDEMRACSPYLTEQLDLIAPKVIVALGATAVEGLLGASGGITRIRGTFRLYKGRIPVMPTFHPAYLLRTPEAKREVWSDLQAVMKHLGLGAVPGPKGA